MTIVAEKEIAHPGATQGAVDHDQDVVRELSRRLDALWRCDRYIANAEDAAELRRFWRARKSQE